METVIDAEPDPPHPRVIERDPHRYVLPCAVCGAAAVRILRPDDTSGSGRNGAGVYVGGVAHETFLAVNDPAAADRILAWLRAGDLAALHHFIAHDEGEGGGLDAYCPDCDLIYCREHYQVREEWDQGFYQCAFGHCPAGHGRKIDD